MENRDETIRKVVTKIKTLNNHSHLKTKKIHGLSKEPPIVSSQNSKKSNITPLKSRSSFNKENQPIKESRDLSTKKSIKIKKHISTINTKKNKNKDQTPIRYKQKYARGNSLCEITKKTNKKKVNKVSKSSLIPQASNKDLKVVVNSDKLTPRSAHHSPQYSHRTPDSVKLVQKSNPPLLTEKKKTKIPEIGYYCKRFSRFDNNKSLYTDHDQSSIEIKPRQSNPSKICDTLYEKTIALTEDSFLHNDDSYTLISRTLKLDNFSESSEPEKQLENNTSPLKPSRNKQCVKSNSGFEFVEQVYGKNLVEEIKKNPFELESFTSPTKTINVFRSPEATKIKESDSLRKDKGKNRSGEQKALKRTFADYDSPGSFVFSLSSNSSDELFGMNPFKDAEKLSTNHHVIITKDEEIQTDLREMITDKKIIQGLNIIGRISECISLSQ